MASKVEHGREGLVNTPDFELTIDRFGKVGFLDDGSWKVGWKDPVTKRLNWHSHDDVWSVLNQNERVIQKFLGLKVDPVFVESLEPPINQKVVLAGVSRDLANLTLLGEITKSSIMANDLSNLAMLAQSPHSRPMEIAALIYKIQNKLGTSPKTRHKIEALEKITQGLDSNNISVLRLNSLMSAESLFARAQEGVSIVRALFVRASTLLRWVDEQERKLSFWQNVSSEIMYNFVVKDSLKQKAHVGQLLSKTAAEIEAMTVFGGNPFKELEGRVEFRELRRLKGLMGAQDIEEMMHIAQFAYPLLYNRLQERERREAAGFCDKFRLPQNFI